MPCPINILMHDFLTLLLHNIINIGLGTRHNCSLITNFRGLLSRLQPNNLGHIKHTIVVNVQVNIKTKISDRHLLVKEISLPQRLLKIVEVLEQHVLL